MFTSPKLKLTESNIQTWKERFGSEISTRYGIPGYEQTLPDDDWLNQYLGYTVEEAVEQEVNSWEP
jgi:hypothetical protein